jgi:hypothetical protein
MLRNANPEIAKGKYTPIIFNGYNYFGGFISSYLESSVGIFHNTGESEITIDLSLHTSKKFKEIRGFAGSGTAELKDQVLKISPKTSVILK